MSIDPHRQPPADTVGAICPLCGAAMRLIGVSEHTPLHGTDEYTFACWRCDIDRKYVVERDASRRGSSIHPG